MAGKKRQEINWTTVKKLARMQCTIREIGAFIDIPYSTIASREEYKEIYKSSRAYGRASLRRLQWKAAEAGNTTMLIWLGKQYLGQKEPPKDINIDAPQVDLKTISEAVRAAYSRRSDR